MKKITMILIAFACISLLLFSTCKKETTGNGTSALSVRLKDAPENWNRCMVEIRGVRLHTSNGGWITLPINDTTIDILKLQDTSLLLGTIDLNAGTITEVDLLLGTHDSITIGGATFVLAPLAGDSDDISIKVNDALIPGGSFTMILDLNAGMFTYPDGDDHDFHWHDGCLTHAFARDSDDHHGH